ncbi:diacylglycerol/lipid kinase family protein [Alteriqipengyuania sp. 357]
MTKSRDIWLITNEGSGSVREELLSDLHEACERSDLCIAERTTFPRDSIPTPEQLEDRGVETVVTLGGDGTINAVVAALAGWSGAVLPLPGGTQNLLTHRLHGDAVVHEVLHAFATGKARRSRPKIIRSAQGIALAGLLVGPGTSWNEVREALRAGDPSAMLSATGTALQDTTGMPPVRIAEPDAGEREGYPILELVPHAGGLDVAAYHARTGADFLAQTWALLRQEFREGPHDTYGPFDRLVLESTGDEPLDLLLDGEPAHGQEREVFTLDACPVDLIETLMEGA